MRSQGAVKMEVYPRVCGGTGARRQRMSLISGLSPRVRGNRGYGYEHSCKSRSIPACAGEPTPAAWTTISRKVYPRVCGGTAVDCNADGRRIGLSPRVRGNPCFCHRPILARRSIPACAGEPRRRQHHGRLPTVYPRVCGGTTATEAMSCAAHGLSPRVRGNLGQPFGNDLLLAVYPRVCGGTTDAGKGKASVGGLSPRVRGNPPASTRC